MHHQMAPIYGLKPHSLLSSPFLAWNQRHHADTRRCVICIMRSSEDGDLMLKLVPDLPQLLARHQHLFPVLRRA